MASRTRRARVALGVIALAVIGLGVLAWKPLWTWVTVERFFDDAAHWTHLDVRGYETSGRWWDYRESVRWYADTGFKAHEALYRDTICVRETYWNTDGTVDYQRYEADAIPGVGHGFVRGGTQSSGPPWLWGVTDQVAPSMPAWMKDNAKWQAALAAQE